MVPDVAPEKAGMFAEEQEVASVEVQVSVELPPVVILVGFAVSVASAGGVGCVTFTVVH